MGDTDRYKELIMKSREEVKAMDSFSMVSDERLQQYVSTLNNPWAGTCKLPHGFPVKSNLLQLFYRLPVRVSGSTLTINTTPITLTTSGTDFILEFKPIALDDTSLVRVSVTSTSPACSLFASWINSLITQKSVATYYDAFRLISAGMRFQYSGRDDATAGYIYHGYTNSSVGNITADFYNDPETEMHAIQKGKWYGERYYPVDSKALEFHAMSEAIVPGSLADWRGYLLFTNYSTTDFAGFIEVCTNYECIPKIQFEMITNPVYNYGGDATKAVQKYTEAKEKAKTTSATLMSDLFDSIKKVDGMLGTGALEDLSSLF